MNNYWNVERWRIVFVLFLALLGGMLTDHWLPSFLVVLIAYIAWLLYKIYQLNCWLETGAQNQSLPDNNGIWERLVYQIQRIKKKSNTRKRRMSKLLKRMQGIITGLPYATVVLNENNEIDWANKMAKDYLNIDIKKDRGQRIGNLLRIPAIDSLFVESGGRDIRKVEAILPHDPLRHLAIQLIPEQKNLKLLIARDISEWVNTQKMRKTFIANASHELRTPLTVVSGYLEIMQEDERIPDDMHTVVLSAMEQAYRMQSIIEDLLTLSRLENSQLDDNSSSIIDIPRLLTSLVDDEKTLLKNNSHTFELSVDESLKIKGSEAEIISVCSNLIGNSVRHTQEGTSIKVIWEKTDKGQACLSVIDNGQGIAAEHLAHLTERFYRVDKGRSRDKGGTGLGLAIVQHIIQRHGGTLTINSEVGQGSEFIVCFPGNRIVN